MEDFESYRPLLFSIAYRMTGSASEAEDLVQETYLRYRATPEHEIRSLKSFLSTIVTRLSLDYLKSASVTREHYIGPWLPEPVLTQGATLQPDERTEQHEEISFAFLILLETLTPPERATFLLHEVFDYPFPEIASILEKSAANCRQLYHRAKLHLSERRRRFASSPTEQQRLLERFLAACQSGDLPALTALLAQDVVSWSDGGGKVSAALRPISGQLAVARLCLAIASKTALASSTTIAEVNGGPAALIWNGEHLLFITAFDDVGGRICSLYSILNPDKLIYIRHQLANATYNVCEYQSER